MLTHPEKDCGVLYIVSAPSGAGKTSLVRALIHEVDGIELSVSYTTRSKRPGEQEGVDYHFVRVNQFEKMKNNDEFIEHACVFGNYYGTSREHIRDKLELGIDIILEIDWQGARQVIQQFDNCVLIFILPPSREELLKRLRGRGQDSPDVIEKRMQAAISEISHYSEFDYLIINDSFQQALDEFKSVVTSYRLRQSRQNSRHHYLLQGLLEDN